MSRKLSIDRLILKEYRNYSDLDLSFDNGIIAITGPNGIGKTNILEAISLLMPGRGIRGSKLAELDNNKQNPKYKINWQVTAYSESKRGSKLFELTRSVTDGLDERPEKIIKIDGEILKSKSNISHFMSMVWLLPQMDFLFIGSSSERRKFLDQISCDFFPTHNSNLNQCEHQMRERLKLLREGSYDRVWMDSIENSMAELAVAITSVRLDTISHLNNVMGHINSAFLQAKIRLSGDLEKLLLLDNALNAEEAYLQNLNANRQIDANSGRTNSGPHVSDMIVTNMITGTDASLCSTGEQKSLLISIKIAEIIAKEKWHNTMPIILLDDIISHLDMTRRSGLFDVLKALDAQVFIACTHLDELRSINSQNIILNDTVSG